MVRVSSHEKEVVTKAAEKEVLRPAQWIRQVLVKEARKVLGLV